MLSKKISSIKNSYKIALEIADKRAGYLKRTYLYYSFGYLFQALAFVSFYPFLNAVFSEQFELGSVLAYFSVVIALALVSFVFVWLANGFNYSKELVDITSELREKLGNKMKNMPLEKLSQYKTGELNAIIASDVENAVLHLGIVSGMFFEVVIVSCVIAFAMFFVDPVLAGVVLIYTIVAVPIYRWYKSGTIVEKEQINLANAQLEADAVEYIQGLSVLKALNKVGENFNTLNRSIQNVGDVQRKWLAISAVPNISMNSLIEFLFLSILSVGIYFILQGSLTIASVLALMVILFRIHEPLSIFLGLTAIVDVIEVGFRNIKKLLDVKELENIEPLATPTRSNVSFENVAFAYENSKNEILKNVSFEIQENSLTAIVGPSGSGKTTIVRLITRFSDPISGSVKIGGIDVKQIRQEDLMKQISVVFQDVYLFDDTILNNIRMGKPNASDDEVFLASKKAYAHEFIQKLPNGYKTKVGEIGGALSGGERQRISIARAILKDSPIVILDEPTSSLDTQSEIMVQKALDELVKNRTVIVIAHRLSTISHANSIFVVDNGSIVESGTFDELMNKGGRFHSMWQAQQRVKEWGGE